MKQLKILGLLVVAATALMAFFGAGTASATLTALCKATTVNAGGLPVCEGGHLWPQETTVHAILEGGTKAKLEIPLGVAQCEESTIDLKTEKATEIPLPANVLSFTFNKCGEYSVVTLANGTADIEVIDIPEWTHNGTLTFTGTQIKVTKMGVECVYSISHAGTITGGVATIDFAATLTKTGGNALCPAGNGKMTGAYKISAPSPLWITQ